MSPRHPHRASPPCAFAACLYVLLLVAATEAGDDPAPPPALTALEAGPFREADAVLVGRVVHLTDVRAPGGNLGRQVARVQVERAFKGAPKHGEQVSVTVQGHRPTLDPARPSVPYFRGGENERYVLFLGRSPSGATYRLQTLYDAQDAVGQEKIAVVAAVAEVAALKDPGARERATLKFLVAGLKAPGRWTKAYAARELTYFAGIAPHAVDAATEGRIRRLPPAVLTPDQRFWLRILFRLLDERDPAARKETPSADSEADPWRVTFLAATSPDDRKVLLTRLVGSGAEAVTRRGWWAWRHLQPSLRIWFASLLADRSVTDAAALRSAYAGEEETEVRAALVRGVGLLGSAADVPWLVSRVGNLALARTALLALARVRTEDAKAKLAEARDAARDRGENDLADWIAYLLSPAFEESERQAGRFRTPR